MRRLLLIVMLSAGLLGCNGMFFFPYRDQVLSPEQLGLKYEDVDFPASDGTRLHAWLLPAEGKALGTILFLHGNAENISTHIMSVRWLPAQGFNVFLLDYRGYGASEGEPSVEGVQEDVNAAMRTLLSRPDVNPDRLVVFGQSLGGSIAIYNVAHSPYRQHIRALAVESAFASYRQIAREAASTAGVLAPLAPFVMKAFPGPEKDPITALRSIHVPLIFVHGTRDAVIAHDHSAQLHAAANAPKELWTVDDAEHVAVFGDPGPWRDRLAHALEAAVR